MDALNRLKLLTEERDAGAGADSAAPCARMFTDETLSALLDENGGDVKKTAYDVLLRKSRASGVTLGDMSAPDQSAYYLRLAARLRENAGHALERADAEASG